MVGPCLFEPFGRCVHDLACGGKCAGSQRLDLLGVANFRASVDYFLSGFKELLGKLSELKNFPFNEWVS